ncbi:BJDP [Urbanus proteus nucleopolyhedrovirus]|uniref:BJDP n=1 Tax=Urbanus proteus nucleopolyhedrovirus TaxID=1675866 RepID=A0A161C6V3_9ABAC|nr:BJDP [Urbanus proteus nucleopolyhedrovirus]AKR17292.1 BJDP [Urbanus proteus nucleopolyhedrovirus]
MFLRSGVKHKISDTISLRNDTNVETKKAKNIDGYQINDFYYILGLKYGETDLSAVETKYKQWSDYYKVLFENKQIHIDMYNYILNVLYVARAVLQNPEYNLSYNTFQFFKQDYIKNNDIITIDIQNILNNLQRDIIIPLNSIKETIDSINVVQCKYKLNEYIKEFLDIYVPVVRNSATNRVLVQSKNGDITNENQLYQHFIRYGDIIAYVMCSTNKNCAVIEFKTFASMKESLKDPSYVVKDYILSKFSEQNTELILDKLQSVIAKLNKINV